MENSNDNGSKQDKLTVKEKAMMGAVYVAAFPIGLGAGWVVRELVGGAVGVAYHLIRFVLTAR